MINQQKIKKLEFVVHRRYVPFLTSIFAKARLYPEVCKDIFGLSYYIPSAHLNQRFYYGTEVHDFSYKVFDLELEKPGSLYEHFLKIYEQGTELMNQADSFCSLDYRRLSLKELLDILKKFINQYTPFTLSLMAYAIGEPMEEMILKILTERDNREEELGTLTFPEKDNYYVLEQHEILRIADLINKEQVNNINNISDELHNKINAYVKEYGWAVVRGGHGNVIMPEDVFVKAKKLTKSPAKELQASIKHKISILKKSEILIKELGLDKKQKAFITLAKELVYFRTYRTDMINKIFVTARPLFENLASKMNLEYEQFIYLYIDEVLENKEVSITEINRRMNNFMVISLEPGVLFTSSDMEEINKFDAEYCEHDNHQDSELRGRVAFKGLVTGIVKIVTNRDEIDKVNEGDILVSSMTTPDFVAAMKKAKAFVTDEGGITCHAAIVAREMKKPCVIGTKAATKIFKDGDRIEVDANNGTVKLIS